MSELPGTGLARSLVTCLRQGYSELYERLRSAVGDPRAGNPGRLSDSDFYTEASTLIRKNASGFKASGFTVAVYDGQRSDVLEDPSGRTIVLVTGPEGSSSSNLVAYISDGDELHAFSAHLFDVISSRHYWWSEQLGTKLGWLYQPEHTDCTLALGFSNSTDDLTEWTVASGDQGENRKLLDRLAAEHKMKTLTVDGAPLVRSIVDQEIIAIVEAGSTTVYESAHLLLAMDMELAVGDHEGNLFGRDNILKTFGAFSRANLASVDPYIIAPSDKSYRQLCELLAQRPTE